MNDSNINKPVPYGVTKAQVKRQREFNADRSGLGSAGFFAGVRKLFRN